MFWHSTLEFFWRSATPYVVAIAAALGFAAWRALKLERRLVRNTLGFFALCVAGQLAALLHALDFSGVATTTYEMFLIGAGVALIRLAGLFLFRVALPRARPHHAAHPGRHPRHPGLRRLGCWYACATPASSCPASSPPRLSSPRCWPSPCRTPSATSSAAWRCNWTTSIEIGDWIRFDDLSGPGGGRSAGATPRWRRAPARR
ncbi:MAG: hypothetical protein MZW92_11340 [Comamonadaceae bacterium]|nr:hypothetical protein [Comamonadaceae bacterium]